MKKSVKTKVFAAVLSAAMAVSTAVTVSMISASASDNDTERYIIIARSNGSTFTMPIKGEDWTYYADSLNVKVSCDFDYSANLCKFKLTAVKPGTVNIVLKTQNENGTWTNTPIQVVVYENLEMKAVQLGNAYITAGKSSSETKVQPEKKEDTPVEKKLTADSEVEFAALGEDWTYYTDSLNVKITCDFDYYNSLCKFKLTAVKPGTANVVLKTQRTDGQWNNIVLAVAVSDDMKISAKLTGDYVTPHSYTE